MKNFIMCYIHIFIFITQDYSSRRDQRSRADRYRWFVRSGRECHRSHHVSKTRSPYPHSDHQPGDYPLSRRIHGSPDCSLAGVSEPGRTWTPKHEGHFPARPRRCVGLCDRRRLGIGDLAYRLGLEALRGPGTQRRHGCYNTPFRMAAPT